MLGGNQFKSDSNRLTWNVASTSNDFVNQRSGRRESKANFAVELKPMEIRSFIITLTLKN